jgi:hypothetical protein
MNDLLPKLKSLRDELDALRQELAHHAPAAAMERLDAVARGLNALIRETGAGPAAAGQAPGSRPPPADVEKCPRCNIRSLHMLPGKARAAEDGSGTEVPWHCTSCGHEEWRPRD